MVEGRYMNVDDESFLFGKENSLLEEGNKEIRGVKMDEEEKQKKTSVGSGSVVGCNDKRVRLSKKIQQPQGEDCEDDYEPIGSMLKLNNSPNPKKIKSGVNVGKVDAQVREEDSIRADKREIFEEMDDTLANVWKKLKGPRTTVKDGVESGMKKGNCSGLNVGELHSKEVKESLSHSVDSFDLSMDRVLTGTEKGSGKRSRLAKKMGSDSEVGDIDQESGDLKKVKKKLKKEGSAFGESCSHSSNENLDFSLSTFVQKSQSCLAGKSHSQKMKRGTPVSGDGFAQSPDAAFGHASAQFIQSSHSASMVSNKNLKPECGLSLVSSKTLKDPAIVHTNRNGVSTEPCDAHKSTTVYCSDASGEPYKSCELSREESLVPSYGDDIQSRQSKGKRDTNGLDRSSCLNQHSEYVFEDLSSKKSTILISKIEAEVTARGDDFVQLSGETAQNSLIQISDTNIGETRVAPVVKQMEESSRFNEGLHSVFASSNASKDAHFCSPNNHKEEPRTTGDITNHLSDSLSPAYVAHTEKKESYLSKGSPAQSQDEDATQNHDGDATCFHSTKLAPIETFPGDAEQAFDPTNRDKKLEDMQRAARKIRSGRHGDMAYEGDTDWDFLLHEQGLFEGRDIFNGDRSSRKTDKSNYSSMVVEAENCCAAAVAAGLKARTICPIEKIKFKEILKRRGGLQEYLECRLVLSGLWGLFAAESF